MKSNVLFLVTLLSAAGAGSAFAVAPTAPKPETRVSVVFVEPQKFTDVKDASWSGNSPDLLDRLQRFMSTTGGDYVPANLRLDIKVTDIGLAGKFEPWRGPPFDEVRIVRSIYPPYIKLEFRLTDAKGEVVKEGKREIRDPAFPMREPWPKDDYLRYEKNMLRDWFRTEFASLRKS
jgi:hypothetical protein